MNYIFAAIGGSGSTHLIRTLATRYEVGAKPDTVFRPSYPELRIGDLNINQGTFAERSHGYAISTDATLEEILPEYVRYLRRSPSRTAVFNTAAELGLFSKYEIPDVVFLIRHPLHAFASWAKPERHGDIVRYLGGLNSPVAIERFARRWNAVVDEMRRLQEAGILGGYIRYEYAASDARPLGLGWIYRDLDSSRRNSAALSEVSSSFLQSLVHSRLMELYDVWDI